MKTIKLFYIPISALLFTGLFASCNDDFVNTKPLSEVPQELVWTDAGLAQAFVNDLYNGLGQGGFNEQMLASLTDESMFTHPGRGINTITESRSNPADQGWIVDAYEYGNMYKRIRATNIAIANLIEPKFDNEAKAKQMLGEAYFLRAYYYQQLLRFYGAIPLITKIYSLEDTDLTVARNTYEECVNFIVKDCDDAATLLAGTARVDGRTSEAAALALKARVLTYAASDLHDVPTAKAKSTVISAYANPEYLGYVTGNRNERWQKAKTAAKAVLDQSELAYKLDLSAPASPTQGRANYIALAMGGNSKVADVDAKRDLIFGRFFNDLKDEAGAYVGRNNGPNGYHNWSGNSPIQLLVDDYETLSGEKFDWNNPTHKANVYKDRDPRLGASILYDGATWKPRTDDVKNRDPFNQIQTGQYEITNASGVKSIQYGLDTRNSPVEDWNGSYTGYYMRKFVDADPAMVDQNTRQHVPWPVLRYTEAVLNYVEACIELGEDAEARTWLNKIRFRAGMPAVTESGASLKGRYRNERRVELAYEEHRFFDTRRWMIAKETLGRQVTLINIFGTLKAGKLVSLYQYNPDNYNYSYTVNTIAPGIENRNWLDKMYFISIHRDEMNRNTKLIQNPGY
ncbi:RagB/SusD family nutrient uptake outer membrane protein [Sphingobacterium sp. SRCM116780]|uniref:RagB/SusD family nutrient uptake outer membrane protein n=1 Tax=Sphingobacterium sp. SRCM116780 TaxID=2907623 RepID=UPI001F30D3B2|nr:RagB/SusD family nutrient uptake outer membrane protein [Sphingobacterium sp. SRCM116780]UIR56435.1 RagB/SusD family nutrient uptake outer membrane protein [Sphingobacterium sp. SRCM116780]